MSENDVDSKNSLLFMGLVTSFQQNALQTMGKLVDPLTGKTEVSLEGASAYIDLLDMLAARTKGNISEEESSTLEQIISHLKLNYVEEMNKPKEDETESKSEDTEERDSSDTTKSDGDSSEKTES
ncbi:hypothetical protein CEE37_06130 [candidate division LCP-89 bacterium B3_LCP]|uniref:DUF1844 domain-containing protein n=1 Tax=candidate division LCP-89 bacterium B3_LCP TaxID=2012998 RepID=A0A532V202_UNCL8|nr:MAG: hypothetical protein CEE37_06130 [candidate division LCP-89 bacterium B3_LCP]